MGKGAKKEKSEKAPPAGCEGMISMGDFAVAVGVSKQAVSKAIKAGKLTRDSAFKQVGKGYWFDEEKAKGEWSVSIKVNQVKNPALLTGLGIDKEAREKESAHLDAVAGMTIEQVKSETMRTELRLLLIQEDKERGLLIEREKVEQNLQSFGIEMRTQFTNITAGVTAKMRAAANISEAENILATAINEALNAAADILEKDIAT